VALGGVPGITVALVFGKSTKNGDENFKLLGNFKEYFLFLRII